MKVYVAGHRGFVGRTLVERLNSEQGLYPKYTPYTVDFRNKKQTRYSIRDCKPDAMVICSAVVGGIAANIKDPYKFLMDNLMIQNTLIELAIEQKVEKVIFLGSSCIYPKDYKQPLKEEYLMAAPLEPTNEGYALAKIAGLKACEYANKTQDFTKFISLMPCNLYGPGDCFDPEKSHVLSSLIRKIHIAKELGSNRIEIWGTGKPRREFLYIDDIVDGIIWSLKNLDKTDTFLNIGTGEDISIIELVNKISEIIGYEGDFIFNKTKPDGMLRKCMSVEKINNLGWKHKTSLDEGIKKTIDWYKEKIL